MRFFILILITSLLVSSCTIVKLAGDDDTIDIKWRFGVVAIEAHPDTETIIADITSLGILSTPTGTNVGYSKQELFLLGKRCKIILFVSSERELTLAKEYFAEQEDVCVLLEKEATN